MILIGTLLGASVLALLASRRPGPMVIVGLASLLLLPSIEGIALLGHNYGVGTAYWLAALMVSLVVRPRQVVQGLTSGGRLAGCGVILLVVGGFSTLASPSFGSMAILIEQVAAPLALFLLTTAAIRSHPRLAPKFAASFVWFATLNAAVAILVRAKLVDQPFSETFATQYWYSPGLDRALGLTDHPLVLAGLLVSALPLAIHVRPAVLQVPLAVGLAGTVFLTASRTGAALALITLCVLIVKSGMSGARRLVLLAGVLLAGYTAGRFLLAEGLSDRLANDSGSFEARRRATSYLLDHAGSYFFHGLGGGGSQAVAREAGLSTSFESPVWIYVIDYGAIATAVYFVALIFACFRPAGLPGARLALGMVLISAISFSSLAVHSATGGIVWFLAALATSRAGLAVGIGDDRTALPAGARPMEHGE